MNKYGKVISKEVPFIISAGGNVIVLGYKNNVSSEDEMFIVVIIPWKGDEKHAVLKSTGHWNPLAVCSNVSTFGDETEKGSVSHMVSPVCFAHVGTALPELRPSTEWAFEDLVGWRTFPSWEPEINQQLSVF